MALSSTLVYANQLQSVLANPLSGYVRWVGAKNKSVQVRAECFYVAGIVQVPTETSVEVTQTI